MKEGKKLQKSGKTRDKHTENVGKTKIISENVSLLGYVRVISKSL